MKYNFRLPHVITAAIVTAIALSIPASALTVDTTLIRKDKEGIVVGTVDVHAIVTKTDNIYDYNYTVSNGPGATLNVFGIANESGVLYSVADNSRTLVNPTYNVLNPFADIEWLGISIAANASGTFSFKSEYAPMDINVYAYALKGYDYADGDTVGMGAMIPEPSSILALALGIAGCAPFAIRRKR